MRRKVLLSIIFIVFFIIRVSGLQEKPAVITGKITDENGMPLAGAGIVLVNTKEGTYSGEDGSFSLKLDKQGICSVKISYTGYETAIKEIDVHETVTLDVSLIPRFNRTEEVIVSATRAGIKTPIARTEISAEELRKNNLGQDLPFLMGLTPSLVETSEAGTGIGYTSFRIRGTDASRINITLDGIPLNDAESQQVFWVDLPDLSSSVDNIQVQRGAGTSSNGAGAFGALVNLQTKSPDSNPFAEISSSAGSFNTFKNTIMAGTGLISERFSLQLRYSDLKSDGYIKRTGSDNNSFSVYGVYKTAKSLLKLNFLTGDEHTGISWWGVPEEMLSKDRRYNPAGEYINQYGEREFYDNESDNYRQNHYQIIYSHTPNSLLSMHAALHYTHGSGYYEEYREGQLLADYGLPAVTINSVDISATDLVRRKWMTNDFYGLVYSVNYKKNRIEAVVGGGINRYSGDHFGRIIWMQFAGNTEKDHQWYLNSGIKDEFSIYGKATFKITNRLSAFSDLQFRHVSYKMKGPDDDLKDITQSHLFDFVNPKAGLYFSFSPRHETFLSLSVAHKEPTRADFKEASGDLKALPKPETLYDLEAGYLLKTGQATAGLNLFGMYYIDQLILTGELSNVGYPIMTNVSRSYRTGIELSLSVKPVQSLTWNMNTTLSRNRIPRFTEYYTDYNTADWSSQYLSRYLGGVDIAYSPELIGSSDLGFRVSDRIGIHLISKYVGKQYFDNTMSSRRKLDPYFVNNLRIDFEPPVKKIKMTEIQLLINNLFNSRYESNAYGGNWYENGTEKSWAYFFPQAGINFMVRLGLRF